MTGTRWILFLAAAVAITACGGGGGSTDSFYDLGGGNATALSASTGGAGGRISLSGDGIVDIKPDGNVDVQFQVPPMTAEFGTYKVTVTSDMTVLYNDDPAPGTLYKKGGWLYEGNGNGITTTGDDPQVTGMEIAAGATLYDDSSVNQDIDVNRDIVIAGTLSLTNSAMDYLGLASHNGSIWIKETGTITNEASSQESGHINLSSGSNVIMEGTITASGRGGAMNGWTVEIYPGGLAGHAWITGTIITDGADNSGTGAGGHAGDIHIISVQGNKVDAVLSCDGGSGNSGTGGYGGIISISAGNFSGPASTGDLLINGRISARGGMSTGGNGGAGGTISLSNQSDSGGMLLEMDAALTVSGGSASGSGSEGGEGGEVTITHEGGTVNLAGSMENRGGQGEDTGGDGGRISVSSSGGAVNIFGITALRSTGGTGDTGGHGGEAGLYTDNGNFSCMSDIHVDGGDGITTGGDGGNIVYSWTISSIGGNFTYGGGTGGTTNGLPGVFEPT